MGWVWQLVVLLSRGRRLERLRLSCGPRIAVAEARRLGAACRGRSPSERLALRRLIGRVDRLWPRGPNCYRRVLLEVSLDRGAAEEIVQLGFRSAGGAGSGHAWLGPEVVPDDKPAPYDAIVSI